MDICQEISNARQSITDNEQAERDARADEFVSKVHEFAEKVVKQNIKKEGENADNQ